MDRLKKIFRPRPRGSAAPPPGPEAEAATHAAVAENDPYSFQVAHRRLAWQFRLSVGTNVGLFVCLVVTVHTIAVLVPLKEVQPALVIGSEREDRILRIEPITDTVEGFDVMMEMAARRYVVLLLEIDRVTQTERFREAFGMSDTTFYERFRKERIDTKEVQHALDSGLVRTILVESVDRIDAFNGNYKYAVDLVQVDAREGQEVQRRPLRAYLEMTTRPQTVREEDKFTNPLGITVLDLVLKERGGS